MTLIATKTLRAPKSADKATGTFFFKVPQPRDAGADGTLVDFPSSVPLPSNPATGIMPPTDFPPGVYKVRREIKGSGAGADWPTFAVPPAAPANSSIPGAIPVTYNGQAVLAWDLYALIEQVVEYPLPAVGAAQTAAAEARGYRDQAQAVATSLSSITAGAPEDFDTFAEVAAGKYAKPTGGIPLSDIKKADFDASYAPRWQANTAYTSGQAVLLPNGQTGTAKTSFTTSASFDASNWTIASGGTGTQFAEDPNRPGIYLLPDLAGSGFTEDTNRPGIYLFGA